MIFVLALLMPTNFLALLKCKITIHQHIFHQQNEIANPRRRPQLNVFTKLEGFEGWILKYFKHKYMEINSIFFNSLFYLYFLPFSWNKIGIFNLNWSKKIYSTAANPSLQSQIWPNKSTWNKQKYSSKIHQLIHSPLSFNVILLLHSFITKSWPCLTRCLFQH